MPIHATGNTPSQSFPPSQFNVGGNFPHDPDFLLHPLGRGYEHYDAVTSQYKLYLTGWPQPFENRDIVSVQLALRPFMIGSSKQSITWNQNRGTT
jgi:hypothetical protein